MIHPSHPSCPLQLCHSGSFTCKGCGGWGSGTRYRCNRCNFDLHQSCATFTFPCHGCRLTYQPCVQPGVMTTCDACNSVVFGTHYTCRSCNFHVHPNCVQRRIVQPTKLRPCGYCNVYSIYCGYCNPGYNLRC
ncbi:hypothetical protein QOZ80_9BG0713190 [Eleusine coracana subsp. coracana]|nr:hypothetical protein QOZ80_9BG0713190 [Eleusine coracana subsp. coracana]